MSAAHTFADYAAIHAKKHGTDSVQYERNALHAMQLRNAIAQATKIPWRYLKELDL
jgi:hypothetical protein